MSDKTLIQCDFDGTVTINDVSFMILDVFGNQSWRRKFQDYMEGRISVARFNMEAFAEVKAGEKALMEFIKDKADMRPGFKEFLRLCERKGFRFAIVSNGLDFYIRKILKDNSLEHLEFFAARTRIGSDGVATQYIGPQGEVLENDFKDLYLEHFQKQGYRVIYIGNGTSDFSPASKSAYIFACDNLLEQCKGTNLKYSAFKDFNDISRVMQSF